MTSETLTRIFINVTNIFAIEIATASKRQDGNLCNRENFERMKMIYLMKMTSGTVASRRLTEMNPKRNIS